MTVQLEIAIAPELDDLVVAELAEWGFTAFARDEGTLLGWVPSADWSHETKRAIEEWLSTHAPSADVSVTELPDENWNARWEASIEPVVAGPFVILPTWASLAPEHAELTVLRIDPKMSFGTGHHASTRLALSLLAGCVSTGASVLDIGTGTGVLALGALKLGAGSAIGCDIDEWSVPNARECARLNGLEERLDVRLGGLEVVPEHGFDLIVANIIRSVLIPMLPELVKRTAPGGSIVLAGLLAGEREQVLDAAGNGGLTLTREQDEGEWWACALKHIDRVSRRR